MRFFENKILAKSYIFAMSIKSHPFVENDQDQISKNTTDEKQLWYKLKPDFQRVFKMPEKRKKVIRVGRAVH